MSQYILETEKLFKKIQVSYCPSKTLSNHKAVSLYKQCITASKYKREAIVLKVL